MKSTLLVLAAAFFVFSCSSSKTQTSAKPGAEQTTSTPAAYNTPEMVEGKNLYAQKCGSCHGLKSPSKRTAEQWKEIVPRMTKMANKKEMQIDPKQQELIQNYLVTMCNAPTPSK